MTCVIYFASHSGNTRVVADAIAEGIRTYGRTSVQVLDGSQPPIPDDAALVLVGGPTEGHGVTREVAKFLDGLPDGALRGRAVAVFDTRLDWPRWLSGSAAEGIAKRLKARGARIVATPESFVVSTKPELHPGERERARAWGATLGGGLPIEQPIASGAAS